MGRQHQGMDRPGVRQVPEGCGEPGKMEKTGCKIICGAPTTLAVKELMMMMMGSQEWYMDSYITARLGYPEWELAVGCEVKGGTWTDT